MVCDDLVAWCLQEMDKTDMFETEEQVLYHSAMVKMIIRRMATKVNFSLYRSQHPFLLIDLQENVLIAMLPRQAEPASQAETAPDASSVTQESTQPENDENREANEQNMEEEKPKPLSEERNWNQRIIMLRDNLILPDEDAL